jgi:DNA polymerase-1
VLAHFSEEPALLDAFEKGEDIHSRTAIEVFGVKPEQLTPELRRKAKVINFGVLYGMSDFGLSQELGIEPKEAKKYIEQYFERYPRVRKFLDQVLDEARKNLCIRTFLNRLCKFPDINSENQIVRKAAEREAINAPMQGSAADIIKVAMVKIDRIMQEKKLKSRMIMQVHDELVFEVEENEIEELKKLVKSEMESAVKLKVPLKVDIGVGHNWMEAH